MFYVKKYPSSRIDLSFNTIHFCSIECERKYTNKLNNIKEPKVDMNIDYISEKKKIEIARNINDQSNKSLINSVSMIHETINTASKTNEQLMHQTDEMMTVSTKIDDIESERKQAAKNIRAIIKKIMTDKIVILLLLLVIVGIVTVVVLRIVCGASFGCGTYTNTTLLHSYKMN